jgi:hypothetical protein
VIQKLLDSGVGNGAMRSEDDPNRIIVEGAGDHMSTQRSNHTEVSFF